jgi:hypothetical protein
MKLKAVSNARLLATDFDPKFLCLSSNVTVLKHDIVADLLQRVVRSHSLSFSVASPAATQGPPAGQASP